MALTPKQEKFCLVYLETGNASEAFRQSYSSQNAKESTINRSAKGLIDNPKIQARLKELTKKATSKSVLTKQRAMELLSAKATVRITDICDFRNAQVGEDKDGEPIHQTVWTMKNAEDIAPEFQACIKSVTASNKGLKIELYDALQSKKLLADMLGWNAPIKAEVDATVDATLDVSGLPNDVLRQILNAAKQNGSS